MPERNANANAKRCQRLSVLVMIAVLGLGSAAAAAGAPVSGTLSPEVLRANRELDDKFLEAHRVPNVDLIMSLFTSSPDIFFIGPTGLVFQGREQVRQSVETFLSRVVTMPGVIDYVHYLPAGDGGVIAYGQVTYHRQLKGQPPDTKVVVWTDYRRQENGRWVLVFRHAHWPQGTLSLAGQPSATH